jgi:hypothetical protein
MVYGRIDHVTTNTKAKLLDVLKSLQLLLIDMPKLHFLVDVFPLLSLP